MHRLFGKAKPKEAPKEAPSLSDAQNSLNTRMTALDEKIAGLEGEVRKLKDQMSKTKGAAHEAAKRRAMETLKRLKMYQQQRDQLSGQVFNIDQTAFALETVKDTHTTIAAMKAASATMKLEHKKINLSEIEDMQDDLEDMMDDINDISETLGRSYGLPDGIDDDELEAELAGLEDELEAELDSTAAPAFLKPASLPDQPIGAIKQPATQPTGIPEQRNDGLLI